MSDRLLVATRKGLFTFERGDGWTLTGRDFLAENANLITHDRRDGTAYLSLNLEHFGTKVHRSKGGGPWEEIATPAYPEKPDDVEEPPSQVSGLRTPWALQKIWSLVPGHASKPGEMWCGTIPGGLFHSTDSGESWSLNRPLWDREERHQWFGGGEDYPGIYPVEDTDALRRLLERAEGEPGFLETLKSHCRERRFLFRPGAEFTAWKDLVRRLTRPG